MKNFVLTVLFILSSLLCFSNFDIKQSRISIGDSFGNIELESDSLKENFLSRNKSCCKKTIINYFIGLDLGLLIMRPETNAVPTLAPHFKSMDVHWHVLQGQTKLIKNFYFRWGLDLNWRNYKLEDNSVFNLDPLTNKYNWAIDPAINYKKNKLMARYITAPIMLEWAVDNRGEWQDFGLAFGISVGQLINSRQKLVSNENGKQKFNKSFGLSPQRLDLVARASLGYFTIYGNFGLTPLFNSNAIEFIPNYTTNSVGIQVIGF